MDQSRIPRARVVGIGHVCNLGAWIGKLLFDETSSDVTLVVEGEFIPAHKLILGASSEYFRALLLGGMKESTQNEVVLRGIPVRSFKLLMHFIYTGHLEWNRMDLEIVLEVLKLADLYRIEELQTIICHHLMVILSIDNFCEIYETAHRFQLGMLDYACRDFIGRNDSLAILKSDAFCELSESALCRLISDDTFCVKEIEIFRAVARWCAERPAGADCSNVLRAVRIPLIHSEDLLSTVTDSGLIAKDVIIEAIRTRETQHRNLNFRRFMHSGTNLADPSLGAMRATEFLVPSSNSVHDYSIIAGYDYPPVYPYRVEFDLIAGLSLCLNRAYIINNIVFRICDGLRIAYYIEISVDRMKWTRVIDHQRYLCGGLQDLYFEPRLARYIRLRGVRDLDVEILALKVTHNPTPFELIDGFLVPKENIANDAFGTLFGIERNMQRSYGEVFVHMRRWEWMTHEIGVDCILIMFSRPYVVNSLRMLLKEDDSRAYKYYIETSMGSRNWTRVADNTANFCRSWQRVTFDAHPVLFIRIVGTAASVGKHFSFSRFECPAPAELCAVSDVRKLT